VVDEDGRVKSEVATVNRDGGGWEDAKNRYRPKVD